MKIQLDTTNKLITVEEEVNLGELIEQLEMFLPDGKWKEYTINQVSTPITYPVYPVYPIYPITYPTETYCHSTITCAW